MTTVETPPHFITTPKSEPLLSPPALPTTENGPSASDNSGTAETQTSAISMPKVEDLLPFSTAPVVSEEPLVVKTSETENELSSEAQIPVSAGSKIEHPQLAIATSSSQFSLESHPSQVIVTTTLSIQNQLPAATTPPRTPDPSVPSSVINGRCENQALNNEDSSSALQGFPSFQDGDVLIVCPKGRYWKLHSTTLRHASRKFRDLIDAHEALTMTKRRKTEEKTIRWKIEMIDWEKSPDDTRFRSFKAVDLASKQRHIIQENKKSVGGEPAYLKIYDNFFKCLYNLDPVLSDPRMKEGSFFILDTISLLQAAESLDAVQSVRTTVEARLLRLNQQLWQHVARNSEAWSDIAVRLQSPIIFREAMAHVVGRFDLRGDAALKKDFLIAQESGKVLMNIAIGKANELRKKKFLVERRLIEYYPSTMIHLGDENEIPGRATYATDIYLWQGLTLVRQYLSSAYMANAHHSAQDGGTHFYRCIGEAGDAYLGRDTLDRFHKSFAMSTKGKQCLHVAVEFVKDQLKSIVADLLIDRTQINRHPNDLKLGYLTCSEISDQELPWAVTQAAVDPAADRSIEFGNGGRLDKV